MDTRNHHKSTRRPQITISDNTFGSCRVDILTTRRSWKYYTHASNTHGPYRSQNTNLQKRVRQYNAETCNAKKSISQTELVDATTGPTDLRWVAPIAKRKDLHLLFWFFLDSSSSTKSTTVLLKIVRFSRLLVTGGRSNLSPPCISCTANMIYIPIRPILLIFACCY